MGLRDPSSASLIRDGPAAFGGWDADRDLLRLRGEHDASTAAALSETLARTVALDDADLVIDLSQVEFMSAATVGVVVRTREYLRSRSRTLELRHPSRCAQRILGACDIALVEVPARVGPTAFDDTGARARVAASPGVRAARRADE